MILHKVDEILDYKQRETYTYWYKRKNETKPNLGLTYKISLIGTGLSETSSETERKSKIKDIRLILQNIKTIMNSGTYQITFDGVQETLTPSRTCVRVSTYVCVNMKGSSTLKKVHTIVVSAKNL